MSIGFSPLPNLPSRTEVVNDTKQLVVMVPLVQLTGVIIRTMLSLVDLSNKSDNKLLDGFADGEGECF